LADAEVRGDSYPDDRPAEASAVACRVIIAPAMAARFLDAHERSIRLRCPICTSPIRTENDGFRCSGGLDHLFSVVENIPIFLNPERSVFRAEDFKPRARTTFKEPAPLAVRIGRWLPSPSRDVSTTPCYRKLAGMLRERPLNRRRVLVVGCGDGTAGYGEVTGVDFVEILETDVSLAGNAKLICDASDLPFDDQQFDLVICVAVLEHVLEPQRCVDEIHRVLRPDGLVYAVTPFMQQVHMGEYDFTRFTRSGHRWLFRHFSEIDSGIATGPASVLVWSVEYFLLSLTSSIGWRRVIKALTRIFLGWLTVLDPVLARRAAAMDAAGGFYFMGQRSDMLCTPAPEMLRYYRGADALK
jgi:SAM-dependent methyltransferase